MLGYSYTMGARKKRGGTKRRRKSARTGCRVGTVRFKTRRGKTIAFHGKTGPGCGPRPKPSTRHLAPYKRALKAAAKSCKGLSKSQFQSCVAS